MDIIKHLDELRAKATQGEWGFEHHIPDNTAYRTWNSVDWSNNKFEDAEYISALHNAFPTLRQAVLDGERYKAAAMELMKAVEKIDILFTDQKFDLTRMHDVKELTINGRQFNEVWRTQRDAALEAYRTAIDDSSK